MKTWEEMIKELRENPEKEFISKGVAIFAELKAYHLIDEYGEKTIRIINNETKEPVKRLHIDRKWEEIKEPVDFMTAVKNGEYIRVEHDLVDEPDLDDIIKYSSLDGLLYSLGETFNDEETRDIILNGKWYTE